MLPGGTERSAPHLLALHLGDSQPSLLQGRRALMAAWSGAPGAWRARMLPAGGAHPSPGRQRPLLSLRSLQDLPALARRLAKSR